MSFLAYIFYLYINMAPYLLLGLVFVGILNILVKKELIIKHFGKKSFATVCKAALFGIPLPLCSCSVVPTAIFFSKNGASKGAVNSFLISTPQTGFDSILATYGLLGPVFAVYRPVAAFISGILGGFLTDFFQKEKIEIKDGCSCCKMEQKDSAANENDKKDKTLSGKFYKFYKYAFVEFLDDIALPFSLGLAMAGLITFFIPETFFEQYALTSGIKAMVVMALIGIPLYICATSSIPIAVALLAKGVSPGVAFVFLMAGPMMSIAGMSILYKSLGRRDFFVYLFSGLVTAFLGGVFFDFVISFFNLNISVLKPQEGHAHDSGMFFYHAFSAVFTFFLIGSFLRKGRYFFKKKFS